MTAAICSRGDCWFVEICNAGNGFESGTEQDSDELRDLVVALLGYRCMYKCMYYVTHYNWVFILPFVMVAFIRSESPKTLHVRSHVSKWELTFPKSVSRRSYGKSLSPFTMVVVEEHEGVGELSPSQGWSGCAYATVQRTLPKVCTSTGDGESSRWSNTFTALNLNRSNSRIRPPLSILLVYIIYLLLCCHSHFPSHCIFVIIFMILLFTLYSNRFFFFFFFYCLLFSCFSLYSSSPSAPSCSFSSSSSYL